MKITVHNPKLQTVFVCSLLQNEDIQCSSSYFTVSRMYSGDIRAPLETLRNTFKTWLYAIMHKIQDEDVAVIK